MRSVLVLEAQQLSGIVGWTVLVHPYDIGYAKRVAGWSRPSENEQIRGWDQADKELEWETKP